MTTSSSEARVIRAVDLPGAAALPTPDLRTGEWTRWGEDAVLGDRVTESAVGSLAERARTAGHSQGYAVGWTAGVRDAREAGLREQREAEARREETERARAAEHAAALESLTRAARSLQDATTAVTTGVSDQALELALGVTAAVLGDRAAASAPTEVVERALSSVPVTGAVRLRVSPATAASVRATDLPAAVEVHADPTLGPADALVEVERSVLDLRVATALDRVTRALEDAARGEGSPR